jgi:hypothetical protein
MPVRELIGRGAPVAAVFLATVAAAAGAEAQVYRAGQACWEETPCPGFGGEPGKGAPLAAPRRKASAPLHARHASPPASPSAPGAQKSPQRFYRYPSIYQAEAPPVLPPGARGYPPYAQQPYVLVSQGVWYWPGADDFKMPQASAFEPAIDPSRVISW